MTRTHSQAVVGEAVAAAGRVLARTGPHGFTLREVAAEADVSVQSLYNRFGSKSALLDDVATDGFRRLIDVTMDPRGSSPAARREPLWLVVETLRRSRRFALGEPRLHRFLFGDWPEGYLPSSRTRALQRDHDEILITAVRRAIEDDLRLPDEPVAIATQLRAAGRGAIELGLGDQAFESTVATMIRGLRAAAQPPAPGLNGR